MLFPSCRADVQMFWHPQGTYLAVQVDRFTKTKKSIYTSFELFSLKVGSCSPCVSPFGLMVFTNTSWSCIGRHAHGSGTDSTCM